MWDKIHKLLGRDQDLGKAPRDESKPRGSIENPYDPGEWQAPPSSEETKQARMTPEQAKFLFGDAGEPKYDTTPTPEQVEAGSRNAANEPEYMKDIRAQALKDIVARYGTTKMTGPKY